jgi:hypothetical protein
MLIRLIGNEAKNATEQKKYIGHMQNDFQIILFRKEWDDGIDIIREKVRITVRSQNISMFTHGNVFIKTILELEQEANCMEISLRKKSVLVIYKDENNNVLARKIV